MVSQGPMCDIPLLGSCRLVETVNRNMGPKDREALFQLGLHLQAVGEDNTVSFSLFLHVWLVGWITILTDIFLQESQSTSPFNFLRNVGENKTYDCFMQSTDLLWLSQMIWSTETACLLPDLEGGLQGEPWKPVYEIGERITLSCPHGMHLEGAHSILCEPSLKWSPDVKTIQCKRPVQPSGKMQEFLCN